MSVDLSGFDKEVAVLGAGVMGSAVLNGLLAAGLPTERARVSTLDPEAVSRWEEAGVEVRENAAAVRGAGVIIVAVKPGDVPAVLDEVREALAEAAPQAVVVSLAAGVPLATLSEHVDQGRALVRVMPNTPALVGEGAFALSPSPQWPQEVVDQVCELLSACGRVQVIPEKLQNAATGLSGSGPAYVFHVAEALIEAGVLEGLPRPVATELAVQTLYGAATMLRQSDTHPSLLREQVTSPGGTTAAGLRELDRAGVRAGLGAAVSASAAASARMGSPA
ncbi:pyrroline-5-carboxylate reductase [Gephyromycinifex aptenodytis]|uniref:pyrroline-5-carboxylate reductase n=1 Tax=Gephyromycinifex aptenodytis TaxID=2716227 RepID=UPI00144640D6|nr:pyrroline-5-carboxylate reductase [Gephyromycinifex aptenodytis]